MWKSELDLHDGYDVWRACVTFEAVGCNVAVSCCRWVSTNCVRVHIAWIGLGSNVAALLLISQSMEY